MYLLHLQRPIFNQRRPCFQANPGYVSQLVPVRELRATSASYDTYNYLQKLQKFNMYQYVPENVRTCLVNALITTDISDNTDYIDCEQTNNRYNR